MNIGRKYRNPPVLEALCELHFAGSQWDDTIPGRFFESVKRSFPVKQQREVQEAQIAFGEGQAVAGVRRLEPRIQFRSQNGERMVQLARDLLVVNQLRPYPSFEQWEPSIRECLDVYRDLAHPHGVARLGVRYINRVVIPEGRLSLAKYFTVFPQLPKGLGDEHASFMVRFEISPARDGHTVLVTFASAPTEQRDGSPFLLDIYDTCRRTPPLAIEEVSLETERAHDNVEAAFEGSITDRLRELFEPEDGI